MTSYDVQSGQWSPRPAYSRMTEVVNEQHTDKEVIPILSLPANMFRPRSHLSNAATHTKIYNATTHGRTLALFAVPFIVNDTPAHCTVECNAPQLTYRAIEGVMHCCSGLQGNDTVETRVGRFIALFNDPVISECLLV